MLMVQYSHTLENSRINIGTAAWIYVVVTQYIFGIGVNWVRIENAPMFDC